VTRDRHDDDLDTGGVVGVEQESGQFWRGPQSPKNALGRVTAAQYFADDLSRAPERPGSSTVQQPTTRNALDEVSEAVPVATEVERRVYVERMSQGWRWSLTHRGSGYPMLRITARFLLVEHYRIMVPFRMLETGDFIWMPEDGRPLQPEAWAILDFDGPATRDEVQARIVQCLDG
jgi:hypothetical protein